MVTNEEKILALLESQQAEFQKINSHLDSVDSKLDKLEARLDRVESRLDRLEESAEITRDGVNALIEWAEDVSNAIRFPLPKLK